jgi:2-polyprenyl-3-methyl-5-hydroxy-6-metoxy-1,4-benzoquinol methylase
VEKTNTIEAHYDSVATTYGDRYLRENLLISKEYPANYFRLQMFLQRLAAAHAKSVFEVGVGEGTPLANMAALGLDVAGFDISKPMVEAAQANFSKRGLDPARIQWGDVEDSVSFASQLARGRYDAVIAAGVLPHVRNDRLALNNMNVLLNPGGRLFVEFRNKLFSLFTFNRYTSDFIFEDLLRDIPASLKDQIRPAIEKRLAMDKPVKRVVAEDGKGAGYDTILSKFHNPLELTDIVQNCGFRDVRIHWYHYHAAPPMMEEMIGEAFRTASMALENDFSWRGYFLCSAGVIEAVKA